VGSPAPRKDGTPLQQPQQEGVYCEYCKKKFGSELTFATHVASAKHLKEVQKAQEEAARVMSPPGSKMASPAGSRPPSRAGGGTRQDEDATEAAAGLAGSLNLCWIALENRSISILILFCCSRCCEMG